MHVKHCNQNSKKSCKNPGILQRLLIWKTWDDTLSLSIQNYARGCTKDFPLSSHQHCTHGTMRLTCSARPGLRGCIQLLAPSCQYVYQWRMKTTNRTRILQRFLWFTPFFPPSGDPPDQSGRFRRHKGSGICFFFQSCVTEGKRVHTLEIKDCTLAPIHPAMPHGISVIRTYICMYICRFCNSRKYTPVFEQHI